MLEQFNICFLLKYLDKYNNIFYARWVLVHRYFWGYSSKIHITIKPYILSPLYIFFDFILNTAKICTKIFVQKWSTYIHDDHEYKIKRDYMQNKVWLERTSASSRSFFLSKCHWSSNFGNQKIREIWQRYFESLIIEYLLQFEN